MRIDWLGFSWALLGVVEVTAFSNLELGGLSREAIIESATSNRLGKRAASSLPPFDASQQHVSTTGQYKWIAPGPDDLRGPCPGLNVLSNHGYLPRSGLGTLTDFVFATHAVFGMDTDLSTILAVYGAVFDGQVVSWSIGGTKHVGIGGSHNNYETDSSPLRGDLNQYGSNVNLVLEQFNELYNMQPDATTANYSLDIVKQFRAVRYNESIAKNPYFYYSPFSGVVVSQAAYLFIFRLMANKSAEYPTGTLNKETLKSWMSITGPEDNLTWVPGHERIPENFYRRNDADLYSLNSFSTDMSYITAGQEYVVQPGCNTGKVDTFAKIDTHSLTNGAYGPNAAIEKPFCFGLSFAIASAGLIPGVVTPVLNELLIPIQSALNCTIVPSLNESVLAACPGYSFYGGPTGRIAEGAIQG